MNSGHVAHLREHFEEVPAERERIEDRAIVVRVLRQELALERLLELCAGKAKRSSAFAQEQRSERKSISSDNRR